VHAKILIVEENFMKENFMNMMLATDLLEAQGYQVLQATTVPEARGVLRATKPDLILRDLQLPGVDGLAFAKGLQDDPGTKDVAIVALTAHAMKGDEEKTKEAGCRAYIAKPIEMKTFLAAIAQHVTPPWFAAGGEGGEASA
jgi:CheY-like chemotaxis protein